MRLTGTVRTVLIIGTVLVLGAGSVIAGEAVYEYRQAEQLKQQDEATSALKAAVLASSSSTDQLVTTMQEFVRVRPNEARGYSILGTAYLQKARETADPSYYSKAEATLKKSEALNSDDSDTLASLGELALARHRFAEAIDWGHKSLALNPYKARALGVIGDGQIELGRYDDAIDTFQKMVNLRPDLSSYARVSYARELLGDVEGAIDAMEMAVNAGAPFGENTAYIQVQLGNLYFNSGRLDDAETSYSAALRTYPNYKHAQGGIARVAAARGDLPRAIALMKDVTEVMPLPEFVIALSDFYRAAGQTDEARRQDELVRVMSTLYQANGVDLDIELAAFDADRKLNLASAIERAQRTFADRPSIKVASVLAWSLYQAGRYDEARAASKQALRLGTKDALVHYQAGVIAREAGDRAGAQAALESALAINPHFSVIYAPQARLTLAKLRQAASTERGG